VKGVLLAIFPDRAKTIMSQDGHKTSEGLTSGAKFQELPNTQN
jgi:hypothetical protein